MQRGATVTVAIAAVVALAGCGAGGGGGEAPAPIVVSHELFACNVGTEGIVGIEWRITFDGYWSEERMPASNSFFWTDINENARLKHNGFQSIGTMNDGTWDVRVWYFNGYQEVTGDMLLRQEVFTGLEVRATQYGVLLTLPYGGLGGYYPPPPVHWNVVVMNHGSGKWDHFLWRKKDPSNTTCFQDIGAVAENGSITVYYVQEGWYEMRRIEDWDGGQTFHFLDVVYIPPSEEVRESHFVTIVNNMGQAPYDNEEAAKIKVCK